MKLLIGILTLAVSLCSFGQDTLYKNYLPGESSTLCRAEFPITILPDGKPYVLDRNVVMPEGVKVKLVPDSIPVEGSGKVIVYVNRRKVVGDVILIDLVEKYNVPSNRIVKLVFEQEKEVFVEEKVTSVIIKGKVFEVKTKETLVGQVNILNLSSNEKVSFLTNNDGDFKTSPLSASTDYVVQVGASHCKVQLDTIRGDELIANVFSKDYYLEKFKEGAVVPLDNILFKVGTSTILPASYTSLDGLVMMMKLNPEMKIRILGHTDNSASKGMSLKLSTKRAEAVKSYLLSQRVESKRVSVKGMGGDSPLVSNNSEENKKKNRRVEFVVEKL